MDVAIISIVLFGGYLIAVYNRLQRLWHAVREEIANVEAGACLHAELAGRVAGQGVERPGDLPRGAGRVAEIDHDLLSRRGRCNAAIAAYNTYRAQLPQVVLSRLTGFRAIEFPAFERAAIPSPGAEVARLDVPGLRAVPDPVVLPWPQKPDAESAERRPPRL